MANRLKMALIEAILSLHARGWSRRGIAHQPVTTRGEISAILDGQRWWDDPTPSEPTGPAAEASPGVAPDPVPEVPPELAPGAPAARGRRKGARIQSLQTSCPTACDHEGPG